MGKAVWNTTGMPARTGFRTGRIYTSHAFVMDLIREQAESLGINLRKKHNDYAHPEDFISMSPIPGMAEEPGTEVHARLSVKVPACRWHKKGVPYLDTFHYIHLDGSGLELANHNGLYGDRLLPAHTGVCNSFEVCMPTMRRHTWEQQQTVLQRVLPPLLYTNGLRHDHERDSNGIQGKNLSLHAVQKGTAHTRIQKLPANSEIIHLLNIRIWKD